MTAGAPDVSTQRRRWVVPALHLVSAVMIVAMLYTGASVWRFLRPAGVLLPLTGHAAATAFVADLAGCVWSFFVAGQWPLKPSLRSCSFSGVRYCCLRLGQLRGHAEHFRVSCFLRQSYLGRQSDLKMF